MQHVVARKEEHGLAKPGRKSATKDGNQSPKLVRKFEKGTHGASHTTITSSNFLTDFTKTVEYICRSLISRGKHNSFKDLSSDSSVEHDCKRIQSLTDKKSIQALLQLHNLLSEYAVKESSPATHDSSKSLSNVIAAIERSRQSKAMTELINLLHGPHMQSLCWAHDMVASRKYEPSVVEALGAFQANDDSSMDDSSTSYGGQVMKIVRLIKNSEPLGATIKRDGNDIVVARVIVGGVADRSGCIHVGDHIMEVNGQSVLEMQPTQVVKLLDAADSGSVTFKIIPRPIESPSPPPCTSYQKQPLGTSSAFTDRSLSQDTSISSLPPGAGDPLYGERRLYVRAQFSYLPSEDAISPCPEAGLSFKAGDVLEILNQDDRHWWQARNAAERDTLRVGLIPSATLEERKQMVRSVSAQGHRATTTSPAPASPISAREQTALSDAEQSSIERRIMRRSKSGLAGGLKQKPTVLPPVKYAHTPVSHRRFLTGINTAQAPHQNHGPNAAHMFDVRECADLNSLECRTYEEVRLLYPLPHQYRPIVLIGAPGVGRNELKRRLLMLDPEKYAMTVPHTSRKARSGETDGIDYNFVTKHTMETWIRQGFFIEYGEYRDNLYGTVVDSIQQVVDRGQVCILNPHPQALRMLRNAETKPYVIFIRPPPFPALKGSRCTAQARSTFAKDYSRGFSDEELTQMILTSERLAKNYEHWFDYSLVNGNLEVAFHELLDVLNSVQNDPQWVPASWVQ